MTWGTVNYTNGTHKTKNRTKNGGMIGFLPVGHEAVFPAGVITTGPGSKLR
jgi:hypothetical protein